jgi:hypothetical protein
MKKSREESMLKVKKENLRKNSQLKCMISKAGEGGGGTK